MNWESYDNGRGAISLSDVHMGVYNWCTPSVRRKIFTVKTVHIHPQYFQRDADVSGDIAVVELHVDIFEYVPVCLPWNDGRYWVIC